MAHHRATRLLGFTAGAGLLICAWAGAAEPLTATNLLLSAGAWWRYQDDGSNQGTAWRASNFDDSSWPGGYAELGYGDFDEETHLGYGTNAANKYITYYFRSDFPLIAAGTYMSLKLEVVRDDGVVVYLNGTEIWRNNMPGGAIGYRTLALTNVTRGGETTFVSAIVPATALVEGRNVIAAEIHQVSPENQDISFDLQLTGVSVTPQITRGPYLQKGGTTNITVRWRTDVPVNSQVRYGLAPDALSLAVSDATQTTEHEVHLTGLMPDTRYYYSIGLPALPLAGDETYSFLTAPVAAKPTRIWVIGDAGTANSSQQAVYAAYQDLAEGRHTDVWLMLGDNAYGAGFDHEYQRAVFDMYPQLLRQTVAWSTIGNHETYSGTAADFPFLHLFTQPVNGECGGVASGTERFFSFDYGNIHFVCLDAMTSDRSSNGPMAQWLQADLLSNTRDWLIAFWHHPPYTHGSHNSDWELELVEMRENFVPLLESYGVDLVLCGHSHCYERSFLIHGHYGTSANFLPTMKINGGDGREEGDGPYIKPTVGAGGNEGAVYVVAGSAGQIGGGSLDYPAMFYSANHLGSLVLDISGPTLHGRFLRETGFIEDQFTLVKGQYAFRIAAVQLMDNNVVLRWISRADRLYRVERATTLSPANWTVAASDLPGTGGAMTWASPMAAAPAGAYFRVQEYTD